METQRLRMRNWIEDDLPPFAIMNADREVMAYHPEPLSTTESDALAMRLQGLIEERGWGLWAVELLETGQFIGYVGLHVPKPDLPCSPCVEIGWRLATPFWNKGYATEAAREALRFAFEDLKLEEVVSFSAASNYRSIALMLRIGMSYSNEKFQHPAIEMGSQLREHVLLRLTSGSWAEGRHTR